VEDEEAVRNLAKLLLEGAGYKVITASSGVEALSAIQEHVESINLMLTDVIMPGMSGSELARRAQELHPSLSVAFASGYMDTDISRYGISGGKSHFIAKPYSMQSLYRKIREILDS